MDCTVVALNIEILIFSCIFNKLFNNNYCTWRSSEKLRVGEGEEVDGHKHNSWCN